MNRKSLIIPPVVVVVVVVELFDRLNSFLAAAHRNDGGTRWRCEARSLFNEKEKNKKKKKDARSWVFIVMRAPDLFDNLKRFGLAGGELTN